MNLDLPYVLTDLGDTIAYHINNPEPKSIQAIVNYQQVSGFKLSFITGRNAITNKQVVDQLQIKLPVIGANGAVILDPITWDVLDYHVIDVNFLIQFISWTGFDNLTVTFFLPKGVMMLADSLWVKVNQTKLNELEAKYRWDLVVFNTKFELIEALKARDVEVIQMIVDSKLDDANLPVRTYFDQYQSSVDYLFKTKLVKVLPAKIDKGVALKKWADIVNTNYTDIVVFGNNDNDLSMFKLVKHSYAMNNAIPALKQVAFKVIDGIENDGVGSQLEQIIAGIY